MIYRFDRFELDAERETLTGPQGIVALRGQALRVLKLLIQRAPGVVSRDEILEQVWGHQALSESSIAQVVRDIRHALDDSARSPQYIATRYGRGYQFVADVEVVAESGIPAPQLRWPRTVFLAILLIAIIALVLPQWTEHENTAPSGQDHIVLRAVQAGSGESLSDPFVEYLAFVIGQVLGPDRVSIATEQQADVDNVIDIGLQAPEGDVSGDLELLIEDRATGGMRVRERFQQTSVLMQSSIEKVLESIELEDEVRIQAGLVSRSSYATETLLRGMAAQFAGELDRAVALFSAALAEDPEFDFARYELAIALRRKGEYASAGAILEAMATRLGSDFWSYRIHNALGITYWRQDEHERALAAYRRASAAAASSAHRGVVLTNIGLLERTLGRLDAAETAIREAIAEAERAASDRVLASARNSLASVLMRLGRHEKALDELTLARELFYRIGDRSGYASVLSRSARVHERLGRFDEARSLLSLVADVREQLGDKLGLASTGFRISRLERFSGNFDAARELAIRGLELARSAPDDRLILEGHNVLAALALADRRFDDARAYGFEAERIAARLGREDRRSAARLSLIEVALESGSDPMDLAARLAPLQDRVESREDSTQRIHARMLRARLDQAAGQDEDARRNLEDALVLARERDDRLWLRVELALLELEIQQQRIDPALQRIGELERSEPPAHPFLMLKARTLAAAGRFREAVEVALAARSQIGDWWREEDRERLDAWIEAQDD